MEDRAIVWPSETIDEFDVRGLKIMDKSIEIENKSGVFKIDDGGMLCSFTPFSDDTREIDVPAEVTSLSTEAFYNSRLTRIRFLGELTSVGEGAFLGCSSLEYIEMFDGLKYVGEHAFEGCTQLRHIDLSQFATKICDYAFYGCASLRSFDIPYDVEYVGEHAFTGCGRLDSIYFYNPYGWHLHVAVGVHARSNDRLADSRKLRNPRKAYVYMTKGEGRYGIEQKYNE